MHKLILISAISLWLLSLNACVSPSKLYYFHDQAPTKHKLDSVDQGSVQRIQRSDRLAITVSSTDPALTAFLNPFNVQSTSNAVQQANNGYLVSAQGKIEFPLLGQLTVGGLTTVEASALIKEKLSFFYKDLFVNVNLNGKVYFMNGRNGTAITMLNERMTIFEAVAQSGAQDPFDRKNEVWLIREENGERSFTKLDLNSKNIFLSSHYYLKNNDLIYMMPGKYSSLLSPGSPGRSILTITGAALTVFIALLKL
jgi:polysaccharide export outer membrane protein